jgi:hypothetical protein
MNNAECTAPRKLCSKLIGLDSIVLPKASFIKERELS